MKTHIKYLAVACLLFYLFASSIAFGAVRATSPTVSLTFYKTFGFGFFSDMAGSFIAIATVSPEVIRVEFYLDNQLKFDDSAPPFQWDFDTSDYSLGQHHFEVIAYNSVYVSANDSRDVNFVQEPFPPYFAVFLFLLLVVLPTLVFLLVIFGGPNLKERRREGTKSILVARQKLRACLAHYFKAPFATRSRGR
jgi:hypothetical protein